MRIRKFLAVAAVSLLGIFGLAVPAQASVSHNCPEDYICLYQWLNYGAPVGDASPGWKSSFYNLSIHSNGCVSLWNPIAYWPNGTYVGNNSGSMVINGSGAYSALVRVSIFSTSNCSSTEGIDSHPADRPFNVNDLSLIHLDSNTTAYHTIESVQIAS